MASVVAGNSVTLYTCAKPVGAGAGVHSPGKARQQPHKLSEFAPLYKIDAAVTDANLEGGVAQNVTMWGGLGNVIFGMSAEAMYDAIMDGESQFDVNAAIAEAVAKETVFTAWATVKAGVISLNLTKEE